MDMVCRLHLLMNIQQVCNLSASAVIGVHIALIDVKNVTLSLIFTIIDGGAVGLILAGVHFARSTARTSTTGHRRAEGTRSTRDTRLP